MWTTFVFASLTVLAAASATADLRQILAGACVIECAPALLGGPGCPDGYECLGNGCGTTCQAVGEATRNTERQLLLCLPVLCAVYCPTGTQVDKNGCSTCICNEDTIIV